MTEPETITIDKMLSEQAKALQAVTDSFAPAPSDDEDETEES